MQEPKREVQREIPSGGVSGVIIRLDRMIKVWG
jgi:hypothetical protein